MNATTKTLKDNLGATADSARKSVSSAAELVSDTVRTVASDVSHKAVETAAAVRDGAVDRMDNARDALSETGDRLAETLRRAAEERDASGVQAKVLTAVAGGVSSAADMLRERSVTEIADDIRDMARRHPGLFAAGAAVAGFALARFLQSSARSRYDSYRMVDAPYGQSSYRSPEGRS